MDCLEARQIISEAFDRGIADTPQAAHARKHCRTCKECRTFVEGLALLQKTPPPAAPAGLVDGIVERGRRMAEAGLLGSASLRPDEPERAGQPDDAAGPQAEAPVVTLEPVPRADVRDGWWWGTRIAGSLAAVVIAVIAISLASQGFRTMKGAPTPVASTSAESASPPPAGSDDYRLAAPAAAPQTNAATAAADGSLARKDSVSLAARYVDLGGVAYVWIGDRTPDAASLEEAGSLESALGAANATTYRVWRSKTDPGVIFLRPDSTSDTYVSFRVVYRTLGGKRYALSVGRGVPGYGVWPSLPSEIETPTAADGSPTLVEAGKDDTGLPVYTRAGASTADGFAVAPGTAATDPAGGSPNWTWWVPQP